MSLISANLKREDGFTLLEVIVGLIILTAAALIAMPRLHAMPAAAQLKHDAGRISAALRVTRNAAIAQGRPLNFGINAGTGQFGSEVTPPAMLDSKTQITIALSAGAHPGSATEIRFFPSGRSTGGRIHLQRDTRFARIDILWATGNVLVTD